MASVFQAAANEEINTQPWYVRFKGSILIVVSGVVWILQELVTSPDIQSMGWGGALGVVATVAAFFLNRFTKDGITPSMAKRLEHAGMVAFQDRVSESGVYAYHDPEAAEDDAPRVMGFYANTNPPAVTDTTHVKDSGDGDLPVYTGETSTP